MISSPHIIHIDWDGPFSLDKVSALTTESDYGIYQVYGKHPVYGRDVLIYIGLAERQYFGHRIPQHQQWIDNHDAGPVSIYLGRMAGVSTPSDEDWGKQIIHAERLLIYAHLPAYNSQKNLGALDADLHDVHILNWGNYGDLLPEVSGTRWTGKLGTMPGYHVFNVDDPRQQGPTDPRAEGP